MSISLDEHRKEVERQLLHPGFAEQLAIALPAGGQQSVGQRFARVVLTEFRRVPRLQECSTASIMQAVLQCAGLGLWPGPLGHAYLIPRRKGFGRNQVMECNFQLGYKGQILLAWRGSQLQIDVQEVYEDDYFDFERGTQGFLRYRPAKQPEVPHDEEHVVNVWAMAKAPGGQTWWEVMTVEEIHARRARSEAFKGGASGPSGPWVDWAIAMYRKTSIHRLASVLPLDEQTIAAFTYDEHSDLGIRDTAALQNLMLPERVSALAGVRAVDAEGDDGPAEAPASPPPPPPANEGWTSAQQEEFDMILSSIPEDRQPGNASVQALQDMEFEEAKRRLTLLAAQRGGGRNDAMAGGDLPPIGAYSNE